MDPASLIAGALIFLVGRGVMDVTQEAVKTTSSTLIANALDQPIVTVTLKHCLIGLIAVNLWRIKK